MFEFTFSWYIVAHVHTKNQIQSHNDTWFIIYYLFVGWSIHCCATGSIYSILTIALSINSHHHQHHHVFHNNNNKKNMRAKWRFSPVLKFTDKWWLNSFSYTCDGTIYFLNQISDPRKIFAWNAHFLFGPCASINNNTLGIDKTTNSQN